MQEKGSPMA